MKPKIIFAFIAICLLGTFTLSAQEKVPKPEMTIIKAIQGMVSTNLKTQIIVIGPGGLTDAIDLEKVKNSEALTRNMQLIKKEIDKWLEKGFKLGGFSENSFFDASWSETYILTKS